MEIKTTEEKGEPCELCTLMEKGCMLCQPREKISVSSRLQDEVDELLADLDIQSSKIFPTDIQGLFVQGCRSAKTEDGDLDWDKFVSVLEDFIEITSGDATLGDMGLSEKEKRYLKSINFNSEEGGIMIECRHGTGSVGTQKGFLKT